MPCEAQHNSSSCLISQLTQSSKVWSRRRPMPRRPSCCAHVTPSHHSGSVARHNKQLPATYQTEFGALISPVNLSQVTRPISNQRPANSPSSSRRPAKGRENLPTV